MVPSFRHWFDGPQVQQQAVHSGFLRLYFESVFVLYREEIDVIAGRELIGTIGGSLGLFIGFSFYSYFSGFFELVLQKLKEYK